MDIFIMKKREIIKITFERLHEALNLRDDVEIIDVWVKSSDRYHEVFTVKLSGESLRPCREGHHILNTSSLTDVQEKVVQNESPNIHSFCG